MNLPAPDLIGAVTGAVFGYLLEQSGLAEQARRLLGGDKIRAAFGRALGRAVAGFAQAHPAWYADLFDASFLQHEGAPVLAQLLRRDGLADPSELAARWADSLNLRDGERRTRYARDLEPVAAELIELLDRELQAEDDLRELYAGRDSAQQTAALNAIRALLGADQATPGTRRDYLAWLIARNRYLDPRGTYQTQRQVQLRLDTVYLSLRAQPDERLSDADKSVLEREWAELERRVASLSAAEAEDQREHLLALAARRALRRASADSAPADLAAVVAEQPRLVVLGDPGSGKSTLLRYLALKHAEALRDRQSQVVGIGPARFPLLLRIAEYAEHGKSQALSEVLAMLCTMHESPRVGLGDLLKRELERGGCLVLLDGLDEIVSADERRVVVARIEEFIQRHDRADNRFVITSCQAGYRSAPLDPSRFAHYVVQDVEVLSVMNPTKPELQEALVAALHDAKPWVRMRAAEVLGRVSLATPSLQTKLQAVLEDTEASVRAAAAHALISQEQDHPDLLAVVLESALSADS